MDQLRRPRPNTPNDNPHLRSTRPAGIPALVTLVVCGAVLFVFNSVADTNVVTAPGLVGYGAIDAPAAASDSGAHFSGVGPSNLVLRHTDVRDTVYTTDSVYLDVDLAAQSVTVHRRDGESRTFLISSGTPRLREGIATPTGLFTVQNKVTLAISHEFNDAKLYNWIGVQGGVGFHGLDGTGYYAALGRRPSSHGCIRMSREEIKAMYGMVSPGALIMVHDAPPARVVAFCTDSDTAGARLIDSAAVYDRTLGNERLERLYQGEYWRHPMPPLVHLAGQRLRWGMRIGQARRITRQQPPSESFQSRYATLLPEERADRLDVTEQSDRALEAVIDENQSSASE